MPAPLTSIYRLKITLKNESKKADKIWRTIEISPEATLEKLHKIIFEAFDREEEHLWSFFFGKPYKNGTSEYRSYADKSLGSQASSGTRVKLNSTPIVTTKEIHYLFDYGDEWWHRIEFLGEFPSEPIAKYPRITERKGDSPPQYEDLDDLNFDLMGLENMGLKLNTHFAVENMMENTQDNVPITFAITEKYLAERRQLLNPTTVAAFIGGLFAGGGGNEPVEAVVLTLVAQIYLGRESMEKTIALGSSLVAAVEESWKRKQLLRLYPSEYPAGAKGILRRAEDLRNEVQGFMAGAYLYKEDSGEMWPDIAALKEHVEAEEQQLTTIIDGGGIRLGELTDIQLAQEESDMKEAYDRIGEKLLKLSLALHTPHFPEKVSKKKK